MHYSLGVQIYQRLHNLLDYKRCCGLVNPVSHYLFEQLSPLAQLQDKHIAGFVVIYLVQSPYVRMIKSHHNCHLSEELFVLAFCQIILFDFFGSPIQSSIFSSNFINAAESSPADLFDDWVVLQIILPFHFYEGVPFDFDFLDDFHLWLVDCLLLFSLLLYDQGLRLLLHLVIFLGLVVLLSDNNWFEFVEEYFCFMYRLLLDFYFFLSWGFQRNRR